MPVNETVPKKGFFDFLKDYIALSIVVFSFVILILLLNKTFANAGNTDTTVFNNVKDIIGLFLPIIGTWMGTILAFYFTRENFESASRTMQQTISKLTSDEKLKSTQTVSVMIPADKIEHPFTANATPATLTITALLQFLDSKDRNRIVVMDANKKVSLVVHRSLINDFVSDQIFNQGQQAATVGTMTIINMQTSGSDDVKNKLKNGVAFISKDATLFDARQIMMVNKDCQDVFITPTGSSQETVIGWITNVIVTDNAKV